MIYNDFDKDLFDRRVAAKKLFRAYNKSDDEETELREQIMRQLFKNVGENFYTNHNVTILDGAKVTFGDNVFIAPNCVFSTSGHAIDSEQRNSGLEIALPITVGDSVWIGANVSVLPGVTIGSNTIIGAGSVVNKDIPDGVIAVGNPCRVIRKITEADKKKYPIFEE